MAAHGLNRKGFAMPRLIRAAAWVCVAMQVAIALAMIARAIGGVGLGSGNHIGFDIRDAYWLALAGGFMSLLAMRMTRKPRVNAIAVLVSSLCLALLIAVFDYYNVIVQYDTWCGRGMPLEWTH